jgi:hypothetical protein
MKPKLLFILSLLLIISTPIKVQAYDDEDVSYDQLVNRLSQRKSSIIQNQSHPLDDIQIHAGVAYTLSQLNLELGNRSTSRQMTGFQLSFGIDLFSPNWIAEGAIRNFGTHNLANETRSFRELDLKVLYHSNPAISTTGSTVYSNDYTFGTGISTRYLKYHDSQYDINTTTPGFILLSGINGHFNKYLNAGAEISYRTSLITDSPDRGSFDLLFKMDSNF